MLCGLVSGLYFLTFETQPPAYTWADILTSLSLNSTLAGEVSSKEDNGDKNKSLTGAVSLFIDDKTK